MNLQDKTDIRLKRIINNSKLKRELIEMVDQQPSKIKALIPDEGLGDTIDPTRIKELLESPESFDPQGIEEAIIEFVGRPVLEIQNDSIDINEPELDYWKDTLKPLKDQLSHTFKSIGRIEVKGHPTLNWVGTGWLISEDIIVTNRHVAKEFAYKKGKKFIFKQDFFGRSFEVNIDFKEELDIKQNAEFTISNVLHIEPESSHDMAFLRIKWEDNNLARAPLILARNIEQDQTVAVIGYPARDSRTNVPEEQLRIFGNLFNVKRLSPGEVDAVDLESGLLLHDCATLGGNSGSPIIDLESQKVLGLHFAGRELKSNFGITANILQNRLDKISRSDSKFYVSDIPSIDAEEEKISISDLGDRNGYDENFLDKKVPYPKMLLPLCNEVAPVHNREDGVLNYTNYSVIMHKERRLAILTAVNINGEKWRHVIRGRDKWQKDPRISKDHQIDNDLYYKNDLDRGHLVRRLDPAWGDTLSEAEVAAEDTFFYTNCAPQHKNLNQKIWLDLEEYILKNTDTENLQVSVFTGPVFDENDLVYRDIQIPKSYWKVVVMNHPTDHTLHATGYLLSQGGWLDDIEFMFGTYRTFQLPIYQIEDLTNLDFGDLKTHDPLNTDTETTSFVKEIKELHSIVL